MRSIKIRVLTFATLLALALSSSPTHAAPPTTDDLPRIAQLLAGSERALQFGGERTFIPQT